MRTSRDERYIDDKKCWAGENVQWWTEQERWEYMAKRERLSPGLIAEEFAMAAEYEMHLFTSIH